MNVGHPSNLSRIVAMYGGTMDEKGNISAPPDFQKMREDLFAISASDDDTRLTIAESFRKYNILLEPHGAIAWYGIKEYCRVNKSEISEKQLFISVETAHPAKFSEEVQLILNHTPILPASLIGIEEKSENFFSLENSYNLLKEFILKNK
jgi:threonine synthase